MANKRSHEPVLQFRSWFAYFDPQGQFWFASEIFQKSFAGDSI
jgi:hypothetical protein